MVRLKERRITLWINDELHRQVKAHAALQGLSMSEVVRRLLTLWLRGEVDITATD